MGSLDNQTSLIIETNILSTTKGSCYKNQLYGWAGQQELCTFLYTAMLGAEATFDTHVNFDNNGSLAYD